MCSTWEVYFAAAAACKPIGSGRISSFQVVRTECLVFNVSSCVSWQTHATLFGSQCSPYSSLSSTWLPWRKTPWGENLLFRESRVIYGPLCLFLLLHFSYCLLNNAPSWEIPLPLWSIDYGSMLLSVLVACILH